MNIREALEANPAGLSMAKLMLLTKQTHKDIKTHLKKLPHEKIGDKIVLVLNNEQRLELQSQQTGKQPKPPTPKKKVTNKPSPSPDSPKTEQPTQTTSKTDETNPLGLASTDEILTTEQALTAIEQDKPLQVMRTDGRWINLKTAKIKKNPDCLVGRKVRAYRPIATICNQQINIGIEKAPAAGTLYFIPALGLSTLSESHIWINSDLDLLRLKRQLVHLKIKDAQAHALALLEVIDSKASKKTA